MRSFQQKRSWGNIVKSKPILIFLGILVLFFAWGVVGFWGKMRETSKNREIVENKVTELKKEKERLSTDISKLKTEGGVEESIREKFGLAKEGEELIIIVEGQNEPEVSLEANSGGFFSFFKNWFK